MALLKQFARSLGSHHAAYPETHGSTTRQREYIGSRKENCGWIPNHDVRKEVS